MLSRSLGQAEPCLPGGIVPGLQAGERAHQILAGKVVRLFSARLITGDEGFDALFQVAARRVGRVGVGEEILGPQALALQGVGGQVAALARQVAAQRDQLRLVFESLDENPAVRVIVLRAQGEHFSSGGNIKGFLEASPEHVSKLAWNVAAPARCINRANITPLDAPPQIAERRCAERWVLNFWR